MKAEMYKVCAVCGDRECFKCSDTREVEWHCGKCGEWFDDRACAETCCSQKVASDQPIGASGLAVEKVKKAVAHTPWYPGYQPGLRKV